MNDNRLRRIQTLTELGKERDLDWILCMFPENIFYFSGFRTMLYTRFIGVLVPIKEAREPVLIASYIDKRLIQEDIWSPHWFKETVLWGPSADYAYKTHWDALKAYLAPGLLLGVDAIQYNFYEQLVDTFPGLKVVSLQQEILNIRMVKDDDEIQKIKAAYRLAEEIMAQVVEWLGEPTTEAELAANMTRAAVIEGAEGTIFPTLVSCGEKMLAYHSPPLPRPIKPNELIRVAFGPVLDGYGSDLLRSFCIGRPPEEVLPLKDAFFEAQEAVVEMLKPGIDSQQLLKKVEEIYNKKGCLKNWSYNIGHGLALSIHEPPRIAGTDQSVMQENMILAVEPSLGCPPHGAFAHCDGVRITADGAEWLSTMNRDLVII
ncbi:MAG: aminopeptidase P family protein [Deltaproteobacteria bacterium]|nr:aminopeptidase P family protein [Deltaproteobacteria bacterium]MBW2153602.1 aminopeptidase P family protein [Deltaproteobacteria bacterium]